MKLNPQELVKSMFEKPCKMIQSDTPVFQEVAKPKKKAKTKKRKVAKND